MANLITKIGGRERLFALVEKVYDLMKADSRMGPMFKPEFDLAKLTQRTADFLEHNWGGAPFEGAICGSALTDKNEVSLLWQAHSRVGVTDKDYTNMLKLYEKTLKKMGVSSAVTKEVLQDLERYRDPIVDEKKKHREKWMSANRISAAEEAAWQQAAEAQRQKEQERKERLAAFRRERKKQEQLEKKLQKEKQEQLEKKLKKESERSKKRSSQNSVNSNIDEKLKEALKAPDDAPDMKSTEQNEEPLQQLEFQTHNLEDETVMFLGPDSRYHLTLENWCATTPAMKHQPVVVSM